MKDKKYADHDIEKEIERSYKIFEKELDKYDSSLRDYHGLTDKQMDYVKHIHKIMFSTLFEKYSIIFRLEK